MENLANLGSMPYGYANMIAAIIALVLVTAVMLTPIIHLMEKSDRREKVVKIDTSKMELVSRVETDEYIQEVYRDGKREVTVTAHPPEVTP